MDKENKFLFSSVMLMIAFNSYSFIINSVKIFYQFEIGKTYKTKGVLTKALLYEGISTRNYECEFLYNVMGKKFQLPEVVSVDAVTDFHVGDSIEVTYNIKQPCLGTINKSSVRYLHIGCSLFVLCSFVYSVVTLLTGIFAFIRKRFSAG